MTIAPILQEQPATPTVATAAIAAATAANGETHFSSLKLSSEGFFFY